MSMQDDLPHGCGAGGPVYVKKLPPGSAAAIAQAVEQLFCALPAAGRLGPQSRVLLKPNLLSKSAPDTAVVTHPDVLRAVVLALQSRGVTDILVADSPGGPYTEKIMHGVYEAAGVAQVCRETGAKMYTACESVTVPAASLPGGLVQSFALLAPAVERDFIINLPKMKTHVMAGMSGAVKNLFGLVPGLQKAEFHTRFPQREHFGRMIAQLCATVKADMHIVDGVVAMEGDGPGGGTPRPCGLLFASEDPYAADLALCRAMGFDPMATPVLAGANALGLCPAALDEARLVGDEEAKRPVQGFVLPRSYTGRMDFSSSAPGFLRPVVSYFAGLAAPKPAIKRGQCVGCGKCAEICPQRVIKIEDCKASIAYKTCIRCFCCHEVCPVKAIDVKRNPLFQI